MQIDAEYGELSGTNTGTLAPPSAPSQGHFSRVFPDHRTEKPVHCDGSDDIGPP
jgi:hypothetical protein